MWNKFLKRLFDIVVSFMGLSFLLLIIVACWVIAACQTKSNGFFLHERIGRNGHKFKVVKIKTMYDDRTGQRSSVTNATMSGITSSGRWMRRYKLDELPQLWNVLKGDMSFVGPRPDVEGYADKLAGEELLILQLRPGITGPASIKYKDEELTLSLVEDPINYNDEVIWPDKVKINLDYYRHNNIVMDLRYILKTVFCR
jgi:lipopolysaccharide/colanic/teichoic acid biosynthesis glycosyltransferase